MQFISQGSALVTSNLNLARKRMFLMTSDVARITKTDTPLAIMNKLDKARSFSHSLQADGTLSCTRAAGWKGSKYYYAIVGPMRYTWPQEYSGSETTFFNMSDRSYSINDLFCRMYSIGAVDKATAKFADYMGTLHDLVSAQFEANTDSSVLFPTMVLPPFEGTLSGAGIFSVTDTALTLVTTNSGSIGTVGRYENRTAAYTQTLMQSSKTQNSVTLAGAALALNNYAAGSEMMLASGNTEQSNNARIMYANTWASNGSYYFSGGGWNYSYSRSKIENLTKSQETGRLYGKGTSQPDTQDYALSWAVMPVYLPDSTVLLQVADFGTDLMQTGLSSVAVRPQVKSNIADLPQKPQVFFM